MFRAVSVSPSNYPEKEAQSHWLDGKRRRGENKNLFFFFDEVSTCCEEEPGYLGRKSDAGGPLPLPFLHPFESSPVLNGGRLSTGGECFGERYEFWPRTRASGTALARVYVVKASERKGGFYRPLWRERSYITGNNFRQRKRLRAGKVLPEFFFFKMQRLIFPRGVEVGGFR